MHLIQTPLPWPLAEKVYHLVTPELRRASPHWPKIKAAAIAAWRGPGWNPKTVKLGGAEMAIDYLFAGGDSDEVIEYTTAIVEDHPFLSMLPSNAPRAVKHIYRREVRLKYLFALDGWDYLSDMNRADEAADMYNTALRKAPSKQSRQSNYGATRRQAA